MCSTSIEQQEKKAIVVDLSSPSSAATPRTRRKKRDKVGTYVILRATTTTTTTKTTTKKKKKKKVASRALQRHENDGKSGGMEALLPSFIGLVILVCGVMAKMGFRGRAHVAGIDLGTTNSVICVQAPSKGVGTIDCIRDPATNSSIIPSVVSFLEPEEWKSITSKKQRDQDSDLVPHPSHVIVGDLAKKRIDTHPHHTLYHAKRALGRSLEDVSSLQNEVEFHIASSYSDDDEHDNNNNNNNNDDGVVFEVPNDDTILSISPQQVGSYVIHHLIQITSHFLGHDNVRSAVICVPAKFDGKQRQLTVNAFRNAGVTVTRIIEEPTAAALAYGLDKKENVEYILVYDFGGGTLDISLLHVSSDGYVEVMGSDGDDVLGGSDFDAAIARELLKTYGEEAVEHTKHVLDGLGVQEDGLECEQDSNEDDDLPLCTHASFHTIAERLKIELSSFPDGNGMARATCLMVPSSSSSDRITTIQQFCNSLIPKTMELTSQTMNTVVQPLYDRSILPIQRLLRDLNVERDEIDEVVMVGGTTRMPQIRRLVKEEMEMERINTHIDPDITVAYGAASVID